MLSHPGPLFKIHQTAVVVSTLGPRWTKLVRQGTPRRSAPVCLTHWLSVQDVPSSVPQSNGSTLSFASSLLAQAQNKHQIRWRRPSHWVWLVRYCCTIPFKRRLLRLQDVCVFGSSLTLACTIAQACTNSLISHPKVSRQSWLVSAFGHKHVGAYNLQ